MYCKKNFQERKHRHASKYQYPCIFSMFKYRCYSGCKANSNKHAEPKIMDASSTTERTVGISIYLRIKCVVVHAFCDLLSGRPGYFASSTFKSRIYVIVTKCLSQCFSVRESQSKDSDNTCIIRTIPHSGINGITL